VRDRNKSDDYLRLTRLSRVCEPGRPRVLKQLSHSVYESGIKQRSPPVTGSFPSIFVLNCNSLAKNNAKETLIADVSASSADLIAVTERHYKASHDDSVSNIDGFTCFRKDRFKRKGRAEPSIKRVLPTSLLARSRLRRAVTSQLGTQGRHVCCHTGHWCCVTRSVQVQINDYLRSLSRITVPRLFTYASNDEMAAFAAQSSGGSRGMRPHPLSSDKIFLKDYIWGMYDCKCLTTPGCRQCTPVDVKNKSIFH